jgi:F-type H+-transporting ATPase subunit delta
MAKVIKAELAYANSIVELEQESKGSLKNLKEAAASIVEIFKINPNLKRFLINRRVDNEKKKEFIELLFKKNISKSLLNSLKLLIDRNNSYIIKGVLEHVVSICNKELNIKEGIIYTTTKLTPSQIKTIENKMSKKLNQEIQLKSMVNNFIIGGIKVVIDEKV